MNGRVLLVGAGPGDPELLTLKAAKAIATADVILVDDLVHPGVLAHKKITARVVYVGKRGGCTSTPQDFIERLMVAEAQAGHTVVRLKGGDPFLFGRGGEERQHLLAAGIAVEVINGITSGLAAPAALGIALTHRDVAHGCIFVTGHGAHDIDNAALVSDPQKSPHCVDWAALAATGLTLVVYMGVTRAAAIQQALLKAGQPACLPVAVVQSASTEQQRTVITTLGELSQAIAQQGLRSPAILIIGEVVNQAQLTQLVQQADSALPRVLSETQQRTAG